MSATAMLRRRPSLAAAALYAVLALAFVAPALVPGRTLASTDLLWSIAPWTSDRPAGVRDLGSNWEMADAVAQFQPFLAYTRSRLPDIPLWNPYIEGGRPFLANMQSAVFSPFSWPAYGLPFWWSLGMIGALKLWVPAFGTFLLGRSLGMRVGGALLAGLVAGFGLFHVVWLAWPLSSVWAWLPWLLLLTDRVVRRPSGGALAALAVVVALQYAGGHPETSFHVLAVALLFALLRGPRRILWFVGGVVAGSALAAVVLVPFVELLAHSSDLAHRADREPAKTPVRFGLALALPDYWGRPTQLASEPFIVTRAFYAGALPLLLAVAAVVQRPSKERVAVAATGAVALLVALGVQPFFAIVSAIPGFAQAHNTRLPIITLLCIALLAGWGLDGLRRSRALLGITALIVVAPVVAGAARAGALPAGDALRTAWGFATPDDVSVLPLASIFIWIPFAVAGAALIATRPRFLVPAALALTALDLARAGMGQNPAIPVSHAKTPATPAMATLRANRFVAVGGGSITPLTANVGMRYGLRDGRGYDYPTIARYEDLWRHVAVPDPLGLTLTSTQASATPSALRAMGLLAVDRILQPPDERPLRLPQVYAGADARVYANPEAVPRAFVVGEERVTDDQLAAVTAPDFEARRTAVVSESLGLSGSGAARIVADEPERVVVRTTATGRPLLVLADTWYPGWRAKIDGQMTDIVSVDQSLRGVVLPAGAHTVEFVYRPLSWRIAWIVSLATAGALALVWWRR